MKVLILAGGYATRLWPLTKRKAKPLLLINGKPMITHIVEKLPKDMDVFVATNMKFKRDFDNWSKNLKRPVKVVYEDADKEAKKLGALGGIANTIKQEKIQEDLLVIGGDNYFQFSIKDFLKKYRGKCLICAYDIKSKEDAKRFGVLSVKGKKVVRFSEKPEDPESTLVNTLCMVIPYQNFSHLFDFIEIHKDNTGEFVKYLIEKDEVHAHITKKEWFDVGSFEGYLDAHKKASKSRKGKYSFYGVDFVGKNILEGKVFIDKGTIVENSYLKDCIIFGDCKVVDSRVTNCIIDEGVILNGCIKKDEILEEKLVDCRNKCGVKVK